MLMSPLLGGARRSFSGCGYSTRGFDADMVEPDDLNPQTVRYRIVMPTYPLGDNGTARFITPAHNVLGTTVPARLGAQITRLEWRGDSWSRALLFPRLGAPPQVGSATVLERGWTSATDAGSVILSVSGRWAAVRSTDVGGCSTPQAYVQADGGGLLQQIDNTPSAHSTERSRTISTTHAPPTA